MPPGLPAVPKDRWPRVQALFEAMLDASDPQSVLAAEPDDEVVGFVRRLFENHEQAGREAFLDKPFTFIERLTSAEPPRFAEGVTLAGRFAVERLLGRGGMGEVYLSYDRRLNERVAIKTIRADLLKEEAVRRRFLAEIQSARRVTHRNVCRIFAM